MVTDVHYSQLTSPGIVTMVNGKNKTLYMSTVKSIEQATKPNLKKTLKGNFCRVKEMAGFVGINQFGQQSQISNFCQIFLLMTAIQVQFL